MQAVQYVGFLREQNENHSLIAHWFIQEIKDNFIPNFTTSANQKL